MSIDFTGPQPFNVEIGSDRDASDETGARFMPVPVVPYQVVAPVLIEADADLYPPVRGGMVGPRIRFRTR